MHLAQLRLDPQVEQLLGTQAVSQLQAAAVFAETTHAKLVTEVAGLTDRPAITESVGSGLLREGNRARLSFRRAFMGQAVYEAIAGTGRRRLRLLAGRVLDQLEPPPGFGRGAGIRMSVVGLRHHP